MYTLDPPNGFLAYPQPHRPPVEFYDHFAIVISLDVIFPATNHSPPSRKLSILGHARLFFLEKVMVFVSTINIYNA